MLIPQATLQSPTPTRYLRRIKRSLLQLRHPHRDRSKRLQENLATNLAPTCLKVRKKSRLVPSTNLTHIDPSVIVIREFLNHFTKIDPVIRHEVKNYTLPTKRRLALNNLDLKVVLVRNPLTIPHLLAITILNPSILGKIRGSRLTQNPTSIKRKRISPACANPVLHLIASDRFVAPVARQRNLLANLNPTPRLNDHFRAAAKFHLRRMFELADMPHIPKTNSRRRINLLQTISASAT